MGSQTAFVCFAPDPEWHLAAVLWLDLLDGWWSQAGLLLLPEQELSADQSP